MEEFDHERLTFYTLSLEFIQYADSVIRVLPPGNGELADQLRRASFSITLNIAEGAGEFAKKEKARFYRMAKRSATECAAILDILQRLNLVNEATITTGKAMLVRVVSLLVKMIVNLTPVASGTGRGTGTGTGRQTRKG